MHIRGSTIFFLGLLCLGLAIFVSQLNKAGQYHKFSTVKEGGDAYNPISSLDEHHQSVTAKSHSSISSSPVPINFDVFLKLKTSPQTQEFFAQIYDLGNLGKRNGFQKSLKTLDEKRVLANLMLRDNELESLDTVRLKIRMLNSAQMQKAKALAQQLLGGLKNIHSRESCTKEQLSVINLATARLIFLKKRLENELNQVSVVDPLLIYEVKSIGKTNFVHARHKTSYGLKEQSISLSTQEAPVASEQLDVPNTTANVKSREDFRYD